MKKCWFSRALRIIFYSIFLYLAAKLISWEENSKKDIYDQKEKFRRYYNMVLQWLGSDADGRRIKNYLYKNGMQKIAVYGNGDFGSILTKQLQEDKRIRIACFIDRSRIKQALSGEEIPVIGCDELEQWKDEIDMIVVTPILEFESIKRDLESKTKAEIISIESIIYDSSLGGIS